MLLIQLFQSFLWLNLMTLAFRRQPTFRLKAKVIECSTDNENADFCRTPKLGVTDTIATFTAVILTKAGISCRQKRLFGLPDLMQLFNKSGNQAYRESKTLFIFVSGTAV
jgi:hypothetical protein